MTKNIVIAILAVVSLGLGYLALNGTQADTLKPADVKTMAEDFINENLLQPGITASIGEVSEESGLYKMPLSLPDGTKVDSYITKDGIIFFPEGINIPEVLEKIAATETNSNLPQGSLEMETLTEGTGDQAVVSGDSITVDYTGTLEDGTQFDSSVGKEPFTFTIGQGSVIAGWDQGLIGMKVGEERKLIIPSDLAYGSSGAGSIPPNATLIFTVKLISIN